MARPKTDIRYQNLVSELAERGLKPPAITEAIERIAAEMEWGVDPPSLRTVRRIYQAHMGSDDEQRQQFEPFRWPDSVLAAGLPWDASPVVFEVLQDWNKPPTVGFVKWYWRVHVAAPDLPLPDKTWAAKFLNDREIDAEFKRVQLRAIETYLARAPWRETNEGVRSHVWQELFNANEFNERAKNYFLASTAAGDSSWLFTFIEAAEGSLDDRKHGSGMGFSDLN